MIEIGIVATLLVTGYFFGSRIEKNHYKKIIEREKKYNSLAVSSFTWKERSKIGNPMTYDSSQLVMGETVIGSDYFKTFVVGLRSLIGGRLKSFESLLDRGRREAILRMIEKADAWGAKEIINLRIETSNINSTNSAKGSMPVIEVVAYATALK